MSTPTVFIVDDDAGMRLSLSELVTTMELAAECYDSAKTFLARYDACRPGCLILDVRMPGMSGIELYDHLKALGDAIPVIVVTGHGDVSMCAAAMRKGAVDFLEKPYHVRDLRARIYQAIQLDAQSRSFRQRRADIQRKFQRLSAEEFNVLRGICDGKLNKEIAAGLDVSVRTIQFRVKSLMNKLDTDSKPGLVQLFAVHRGHDAQEDNAHETVR